MPALTGEQQFALESGLAQLDQDQVDRVIALVGDAAWTGENGIDVNIDWCKLSAEKQRDLVHLVDTMLIGKNTMSARTNINRLVQLTADEQKAFLHEAVDKLFDMSPGEPRKFQMLTLASNVITDEPYCNSGFEHRAVPFALPSTPPKATEPKVNAAAKTRASSTSKSHAPKALARPNGSTLKKYGTRAEVLAGTARRTGGRLTAADLYIDKEDGKIKSQKGRDAACKKKKRPTGQFERYTRGSVRGHGAPNRRLSHGCSLAH